MAVEYAAPITGERRRESIKREWLHLKPQKETLPYKTWWSKHPLCELPTERTVGQGTAGSLQGTLSCRTRAGPGQPEWAWSRPSPSLQMGNTFWSIPWLGPCENEQGFQLSGTQTPDLWKRDNKCVLFYVATFVVICHPAIENKYTWLQLWVLI